MKTWQKIRQSPELWQRYLVREKVVDAIRSFFKRQGFHEVETPLLIPTPSTEPFLEVFETKLKFDTGEEHRAFLPSSPEFAMKKLLAAGSGSIFQICKSFRNGEGRSGKHNPEFTILEWYRTPGDYRDIMNDFENLFLEIGRNIGLQGETLKYQVKMYRVGKPWERLTVRDAFSRYADIDEETMLSEQKLIAAAKRKGYAVDVTTTWEQAYNQIFLNEVEPRLGVDKPTILFDYPSPQAAFARRKEGDPRYAERFEVYLAGVELGNAFTELTDATEQKDRALADLAERKKMGKTEFPMDEDFIQALEQGIPETGGIAVGVDRLVMLFADAPSIHETMTFPVDDLFPPEV